jgi:hypothetical protein
MSSIQMLSFSSPSTSTITLEFHRFYFTFSALGTPCYVFFFSILPIVFWSSAQFYVYVRSVVTADWYRRLTIDKPYLHINLHILQKNHVSMTSFNTQQTQKMRIDKPNDVIFLTIFFVSNFSGELYYKSNKTIKPVESPSRNHQTRCTEGQRESCWNEFLLTTTGICSPPLFMFATRSKMVRSFSNG